MKIICYRSWDDIDVEFLDEYHYVKEHVIYGNFKRGEIKNPYDRSVFNIGYVGTGKYMTRNTELKKPETSYEIWTSMLERCYKNEKNFPAYFGVCSVCEEWLNFQNFAEWFENNKYEVNERLHIDKDILFPGNKIYSHEMCLLVPQRINMLFLNKPNDVGLPNGISKTESNKFNTSYCGKSLGTFSTLEEAYSVYTQNKENAIKRIADEYINIIPQNVYDALYEYKVEIINDRNFLLKKFISIIAGGDVMIDIEKTRSIEEEYLQCSSCLKCNDDLDMFELSIGENMRQTITIRLCEECMRDLYDDLKSLEINGQI